MPILIHKTNIISEHNFLSLIGNTPSSKRRLISGILPSMADNSSLLRQLASRASNWHSTTGISQQMMARAIGMEPGNYSAFLKGKRGLGAESTYLLLKYVALPKKRCGRTV